MPLQQNLSALAKERVSENHHLEESYWIEDGFAAVLITAHEATLSESPVSGRGPFNYMVVEAELDQNSLEFVEAVKDGLADQINITARGDIDLERFARRQLNSPVEWDLSDEQLEVALYHLKRDILGYGKINVPKQDPKISEITCSGPGKPIFVESQDFGSMKTNLSFGSEAAIENSIEQIIRTAQEPLSADELEQRVELRDGSSIQILSGEISPEGPCYTITEAEA